MIPSRFLPPILLGAGLFGAAWLTPARPASFAEAMLGPALLAASVVAAGWLRAPRPRRRRVLRVGVLGFAAIVLLGSAIVAWANPAGVAAAVVTFGAAAVIVVLPAERRHRCAAGLHAERRGGDAGPMQA
jgi:peptidoglycan/LPS O-acetylase OafA/YrhL